MARDFSVQSDFLRRSSFGRLRSHRGGLELPRGGVADDEEGRLGQLGEVVPSARRRVAHMDGPAGDLTVSEGDAFNGWHGGATASESFVPLMFNIASDAVLDKRFISSGIPADGTLRSWRLAAILGRIHENLQQGK